MLTSIFKSQILRRRADEVSTGCGYDARSHPLGFLTVTVQTSPAPGLLVLLGLGTPGGSAVSLVPVSLLGAVLVSVYVYPSAEPQCLIHIPPPGYL